MNEVKEQESFNDFLVNSVSKTNAKAVCLAFFRYKQGDILETDISNMWMFRFKEYLLERNFAANTTSEYLKTLLSILGRASTRGYELPIEIEKIKNECSVKTEASECIYLNRDELKMIERYEPKGSAEKYTRAVFLICAYTGCRISDAQIISKNNFTNGEINYTSIKTKATSRLPLHPLVPELVEEIKGGFMYDEDSVRTIVGRSIKSICRKLGMNSQITLYRRGKRMTQPKWAMLSSHTARKSFATNMLLDGYTIEQISKILGHGKGKGDVAMTMGYICTSYTDTIKGDKTYLRPNADDLYEKLVQMIGLNLTLEQACSTLIITGASPAEVLRVKDKYNQKI